MELTLEKGKGHFCIALSKGEGQIYVTLFLGANTPKRSKTFYQTLGKGEQHFYVTLWKTIKLQHTK